MKWIGFAYFGAGKCYHVERKGAKGKEPLGTLDYNVIVYEGICLGPRLADGSWTVFLVSDGGTTKSCDWMFMTVKARTVSRLCALKLSGLDSATAE